MKIFRFVLGALLTAFMIMLYWSSILVEERLKHIQSDLEQIKNDYRLLKERLIDKSQRESEGLQNHSLDKTSYPSFANLLTSDPFYTHTLPKLLGPHFVPFGTRKEAIIGKPDNLHPFSNWNHVATWNALCTVALTGHEVGKYETFTPDMALSMEIKYGKDGHPEYWLILRKDIFWQPLDVNHFPSELSLAPRFLERHRVTAHDFKFYFDAIMNPHVEESQAVALRLYYDDIEKMEVIDDFTLMVRWKTKRMEDPGANNKFQMKYLSKSLIGSLRPLARFVYQYFADGTKIIADDSDPDTYRINPVWAQNFSHHWAQNVIVSCGPWIFDGMTDRQIRFQRNPDYYDPYAVLVESYEINFKNNADGIWDAFKRGDLDLFEVPPNLLGEFDQFLQGSHYQRQIENRRGEINRLNYLARSYNYIGWNETRPFFKNSKIRRALTMAIDRERIIRQNLNGKGVQITGTFFPYSPSYDKNLRPYPFDPEKARQMIEEEGWNDTDGDGVVDKLVDGKLIPFRFTLTYYVKNSTTKAICDYIATALKAIGVECIPNGVDTADLSDIFENKAFDAVFMGWSLGAPPEDPKQLWYSAGAKEKGSSNAIGFSNPEVDHLIDALEYEFDPKKRIELYYRFDAIIHQEAPYTFLYAPTITLASRSYLKNLFIPSERQDLIPGANMGEPEPSIFWIQKS